MARKDDVKGSPKAGNKSDSSSALSKGSSAAGSTSGGSHIVYLGIIGVCLALIGSFAWQTFNPGFQVSKESTATETSPLLNIGGSTEFIGNRTLYPSFGLFPKGCKWRPVAEKGKSGFDYVW